MHRQMIKIGRIFNIPVGVDYSWIFIEVLLAWSLSSAYFPREFPHWTTALYWTAGILTSLLLFVSVLLHEFGHALTARWFKIPVHSIRLFIFGGVAQFEHEPEKASYEFWISLAGPAVNILLGLLLLLAEPVFTGHEFPLAIVKYLAIINIILGVFNLIPGFPLDGGRVLRAILWSLNHDFRKSTVWAALTGRVIAFLFIINGAMMTFSGRIGDGLWLIFIGWFLDSAASAQIQQGTLRAVLLNHKVKEAYNPNYAVVPGDETVRYLMDYHILGEGRRYIVVTDNKQPVGLLTLHHVRHLDREKWAQIKVKDTFLPFSKLRTLTPDTDLWQAFNEMQVDGVNQLPVVDEDGKFLGILSRADLLSFLKQIETKGKM